MPRCEQKQTGAEGRDRTGDTVIFSHVLYQLSYLGTAGNSIGGPVVGGESLELPTSSV
jgi:hypothetical protein